MTVSVPDKQPVRTLYLPFINRLVVAQGNYLKSLSSTASGSYFLNSALVKTPKGIIALEIPKSEVCNRLPFASLTALSS